MVKNYMFFLFSLVNGNYVAINMTLLKSEKTYG